jgi:hypothetical protein
VLGTPLPTGAGDPATVFRCSTHELERRSDSLVDRVKPGFHTREFTWSLVRALPSWLTSCVVHLIAMIVLALITVPFPPRTTGLRFTFDSPTEEEIRLVELTQPEVVELDAIDTQEFLGPIQVGGADTKPPIMASVDPALDRLELSPSTQLSYYDGPQGDMLLYVILPVRPEQSKPLPLQAAGDAIDMARAIYAGEPMWGTDECDQVVYRFILYDIGKLRGEEAQQALADFNALDSDAIPALVRGLNASAYISASCPVVVLSSKVSSQLTQANNPQTHQYALNNIGRGVDPRAAHAAQLAGLRDRLAAEAGVRGRNGEFAHNPGNSERAQLVQQLARSHTTSLRRALQSDDPDERWAAARVTAARGIYMVEELIPHLYDKDESVRLEVHHALVRLARGSDFGPSVGASEEDIAESVDLWSRWWTQSQGRKSVSEVTPEEEDANREKLALARLEAADTFREEGRPDAALRIYRTITRKFIGTKAAEAARERLKRD